MTRRPRSLVSLRLFLLAAVCSLVLGINACATGANPPIAIVEEEDAGTVKPQPTATVTPPVKKDSGPAVEDSGKTEEDSSTGDLADVPVLDDITPSSGIAGSPAPTLVLTGRNFVPRTVVQLDGQPLATTFVTDKELKATLPTAKLATPGTLSLSVGTSPPGGGVSKEVVFSVVNAAPTVTQIAPLSVIGGSPQVTLTVTGTGFVAASLVYFDGGPLTTTFKSATSLEALIPANKLVTSGSFDIIVKTPAPGGGNSAAIAFSVTNPNVSVSGLSPNVQLVSSPNTALTVTGSGFVAASKVLFNGVGLTTVFVSSTQLTATIPAAQLINVGDFPVAVQSPPPGGGVSAPLSFRVQYPVPSISSLSPNTAGAGSGPTVVTVNGANFFPASQITLDNGAQATTYVSTTQLRATIPANLMVSGGTINVRVITPTPGGGTSSALPFTVQNPGPQITSVSPGNALQGAADTPITVTGTNFVPGTIIRVDLTNLVTTFVSSTQIKGTIGAGQLVNAGALAITAVTPAPGGGTSNVLSFNIGCNTQGVDVQLGAIGNTTTVNTDFANAPSMNRIYEANTCPVDLSTGMQPGRYWIVQNTAGAPVKLSAWAVCTASGKSDDAHLVFYRRPTPPVSLAERSTCTGVTSEGSAGIGGYASPESGTSVWCPGLTKANGGAITMSACERIVVFSQPYDVASATYPAPPQLKFRPEAP
jgi:hypothetical protein